MDNVIFAIFLAVTSVIVVLCIGFFILEKLLEEILNTIKEMKEKK